MFSFNPAVHAFERPSADCRIDQPIFYRIIIIDEARPVLGQGPDFAGLIRLNQGGKSRRIGGVKDMATRAQVLDQLAWQGGRFRAGRQSGGRFGFFCSGEGMGGVASLPNIKMRTGSLKGNEVFGFS